MQSQSDLVGGVPDASFDEIQEYLRLIVVETQYRCQKPSIYFDPDQCYSRKMGTLLPECTHGNECRQDSAYHWNNYNHPMDHKLIVSKPVSTPIWKIADVTTCRHFSKTGHCKAEKDCRFFHSISSLSTHKIDIVKESGQNWALRHGSA